MKYFYLLCTIFLLYFYIIKSIKYKEIRYLYDRTNKINKTLLKISEELANYEDINTLYKKIIDDTVKLIKGADCGSILIYNRQKDIMEYVAATSFDLDELKKVNFKIEELYLYKTTKLKSPAIIKNPRVFDSTNIGREKFNTLLLTDSLNIKSTLSAPLYINGEFYGIINVDSKKSENAFNENDIKLIKYITRLLEGAIKNVLLMNELIQITRIDKLTDIYNRRYFEELMKNEIKRCERYGNTFSLVMIDMDNFKMINDNYGHNIGDEVLKYFVYVLKHSIRATDILARYAGDEFIIVMHDSDSKKAAQKIESIREYFKKNYYSDISIEFSAGICTYWKGASLEDIIISADSSMYEDKRKRKLGSCVNI
ncbi:sensor domain-containing diguanylate cyclase [Caloramator sp. E03]|uniref:sensor domain-containing diguanylate cyclase n=1 Tax=Caloramator sp. E03 TaxID=2576307 RepID=UPI0011105DA6|nr:sensor domain-containing diguanylate cyclase [Caloramator sp. E03]QCX33935.1 sensor domain-containing diguanylate cyclase [Caloramator sp. E03]